MTTAAPRSSILNPRSSLSLIVAMSKNRVIGIDNALPWHLPADLKHFKALTLGHHIIMGRKTWESINRQLPGRTTVIVTRQQGYVVAGAVVVHTTDAAIAACGADDEIFVIGGEEIFKLMLPRCQRMYVTEIQQDFAGDAYFPEFDRATWRETSRDKHALDEANKLEYHFVVYDRPR